MIVVKVSNDAKTGELIRTVQRDNGTKFRIFGEFDLQAQHLYDLATLGRDSIVERVQDGIGSDDQPFPPLSRHYAVQKTRAGKGNRRTMTFTGQMLDDMQVRSISNRQARISISSSLSRIKAKANEERTPWYGFSPNDIDKLSAAGEQVFHDVVDAALPNRQRGTNLRAIDKRFFPATFRPSAKLAA